MFRPKNYIYIYAFIIFILSGCSAYNTVYEEGIDYEYSVFRSYDYFEGDSTVYMNNGKLDGYPAFFLNILIKKKGNKPDRYYFKLLGYTKEDYKVSSHSNDALLIYTDKTEKGYSSYKSEYQTLSSAYITFIQNELLYKTSLDELKRIADSKRVSITVKNVMSDKMNFSFTKNQINGYKHFINKYIVN